MRNVLIFLSIIAIIGCRSTPAPITQVNEEELGRQAFETGNYEGAADYYSQWLAKYPESWDIFVERGRAYNKMQKYELALKDFELSAEKSPSDLRCQVYRCGVLVSMNKYPPAQKIMASVMSDPKISQLGPYELFLAYSLDGQCKNMSGDYENALTSIEEALKVYESHDVFKSPGYTSIYRLVLRKRAVAYHALGNYRQAAADMEQYLSLSEQAEGKGDPKDYQSLALALYMSDNYDRCRQVLPRLSPQHRRELAELFPADTDFFTPAEAVAKPVQK